MKICVCYRGYVRHVCAVEDDSSACQKTLATWKRDHSQDPKVIENE